MPDEPESDSAEGGQRPGTVAVHGGRAGDELASVGMLGGAEEFGGRGLLDQAPVLHDGDPVGDLADYG